MSNAFDHNLINLSLNPLLFFLSHQNIAFTKYVASVLL